MKPNWRGGVGQRDRPPVTSLVVIVKLSNQIHAWRPFQSESRNVVRLLFRTADLAVYHQIIQFPIRGTPHFPHFWCAQLRILPTGRDWIEMNMHCPVEGSWSSYSVNDLDKTRQNTCHFQATWYMGPHGLCYIVLILPTLGKPSNGYPLSMGWPSLIFLGYTINISWPWHICNAMLWSVWNVWMMCITVTVTTS